MDNLSLAQTIHFAALHQSPDSCHYLLHYLVFCQHICYPLFTDSDDVLVIISFTPFKASHFRWFRIGTHTRR